MAIRGSHIVNLYLTLYYINHHKSGKRKKEGLSLLTENVLSLHGEEQFGHSAIQ